MDLYSSGKGKKFIAEPLDNSVDKSREVCARKCDDARVKVNEGAMNMNEWIKSEIIRKTDVEVG